MGPLQITATHEHRYHDQHLDLDFEHKTALRDTKPLRLTRKEYAILALLIQNAGEVVTRGQTVFHSRGSWVISSAIAYTVLCLSPPSAGIFPVAAV
jgi:DNA-binding response OmpR family regulator